MNTIAFITTAASIYATLYTLWIILLFVMFANLTPLEQHRAKITVGGKGLIVYILSISWIITQFIG